MQDRNGSDAHIECIDPDCGNTPIAGAPLSLCGHHFRKAHEYVSDILLMAGQADEDKILELVDAFDAVPFRRRLPTEAELAADPEVKAQREETERFRAEYQAYQLRIKQAQIHDPLVYYLQFGDRVKIGTTTNLKNRMLVIPHDRLLATEPGDQAWEHHRHLEFAALRITGEWFHYRDPLTQHIARLTTIIRRP